MLFRREFASTVSGSRGSSGLYSHLVNPSLGHGASNQRPDGQPKKAKSFRRKHTWYPARSTFSQSPAANVRWRILVTSPGMASIADEEVRRLPLGSMPVTRKISATSQTLLFEWPDEQENHIRSKRARRSLDGLLNVLCAANETVSHSRRTRLQLYVSQRLRLLSQVCEKHRREAKMTCKASWRRVFDCYLSLQRFSILHSLKPEREKEGFYHRLVGPSTGSMGEIQRATEFAVSQDMGRISDTIRTVFSNRTGIYHHMKALLVCWIFLLPGRWFRKSELTDNILRRPMTRFRLSMAKLGQPLERLYRRGRGLYQRPTEEWREIHMTIDSCVRVHKPVVPPVYLSVRGGERNASGSTKRLRQSSWPKTVFFQCGAPMKASQHSVSVTRTKATTLHTSSAAPFKVSASTEHSRPRPYLSLRPARKKEERYSLSDRPDYERMRTIWGSVLSSLDGLIDALREPMDRGVDCASSRPLLLYALEFSRLRRELDGDCYEARLHVRLREDWQSILHGSKAGYDSLRLALLNRLCEREERLAERLFSQSLDRLYGGYLPLEQFRRLYALCSLTERKKLYHGIVGAMINTGNHLRLMIFRGFKTQDEAIYPFRQFQKSFVLLVHKMHELVVGWLEPWGDYKLEFMVDRDTMRLHITRLRRSGQELGIALGPAWVELKKACRPPKQLVGLVRVSRPGQYVLRPESGNRSQIPAAQNSLPSYLAEDGKDRKGGIDELKWSPWARFPLRSTTHLLKFSSVVGTSNKQAALFHTSATTKHPATSPAAEIGVEDSLEEETNQVNRGKETVESPICSPRGYHIPSAKQRECVQASTATRSAYWQYSLYQGPKGERVKVHYCKSRETTERISKLFLNEKVIGFDVEWKPSASAKDGIRKNVAMIQLASEERIALFHLARFSRGDTIEDLLAPTLKRIMESDAMIKVGVSIKSDCTRLRNHLNLDCRGLFELSHLYKLVKHADQDVKKINKKLVSLATQTEEHLKLPMYKDQSVRSSDWSGELNYEQIYCNFSPLPKLLACLISFRCRFRLLRCFPTLLHPRSQAPIHLSCPTAASARRSEPAHSARKRPNSRRVRRSQRRRTTARDFGRCSVSCGPARGRRHEPPVRGPSTSTEHLSSEAQTQRRLAFFTPFYRCSKRVDCTISGLQHAFGYLLERFILPSSFSVYLFLFLPPSWYNRRFHLVSNVLQPLHPDCDVHIQTSSYPRPPPRLLPLPPSPPLHPRHRFPPPPTTLAARHRCRLRS